MLLTERREKHQVVSPQGYLCHIGQLLANTCMAEKKFVCILGDTFIDVNVVTTVDNAVTSVDSDSKDMDESTTTSFGTSGAPAHRDEYDWDHLSEPPDAGEIDQRNSDSSDFEETYIKRKTRRKDKKVSSAMQALCILFTTRCYASAVLAMGLCLSLCLSVCLCLSQIGVLLKRLNVGSHKQHHTIAQGL